MPVTIELISAGSVLLPAFVALFRFTKINRTYDPFIFLIWIACINEVVSQVVMDNGISSNINNNIYVLIESVLFTTFFKGVGLFSRYRFVYTALITLFFLVWIAETLILGNISIISSYFRILYSTCIVFMGIPTINRLIMQEINKLDTSRRSLIYNSIFLISIGAITFFTYKLVVEIFWVWGLFSSPDFKDSIYDIMHYVNIFVNFLFALAILWMPRKQGYILLS